MVTTNGVVAIAAPRIASGVAPGKAPSPSSFVARRWNRNEPSHVGLPDGRSKPLRPSGPPIYRSRDVRFAMHRLDAARDDDRRRPARPGDLGRRTINGTAAEMSFRSGPPSGRTDVIGADAVFLPTPVWGSFDGYRGGCSAAPGSTIRRILLVWAASGQVGETVTETLQTTRTRARAADEREAGRRASRSRPKSGATTPDISFGCSIPAQTLMPPPRRDLRRGTARRGVAPQRQEARLSPTASRWQARSRSRRATNAEAQADHPRGAAGPADRDESAFGIDLGEMAGALADAGTFVVRFDKRGVGRRRRSSRRRSMICRGRARGASKRPSARMLTTGRVRWRASSDARPSRCWRRGPRRHRRWCCSAPPARSRMNPWQAQHALER